MLELRHNNAYDVILDVRGGVVIGVDTVTPAIFADFAGESHSGDWYVKPSDDAEYNHQGPDAYGELVATKDGVIISVEDERLWAECREAYAR